MCGIGVEEERQNYKPLALKNGLLDCSFHLFTIYIVELVYIIIDLNFEEAFWKGLAHPWLCYCETQS